MQSCVRMVWTTLLSIAGAIPTAPSRTLDRQSSGLWLRGPSKRDLCLILRSAACDAVFGTLYSLDDPGVDGDDVFMLFEALLTADPSRMEGRPGSAEKSGL